MGLSRREFIKLCMSSAAGASLITFLGPELKKPLAYADDGMPPVIWIQGASCTGCSISLLNSVEPAIEKVLLEMISLKYHPNISAAQGHEVYSIFSNMVSKYNNQFILVVEGGIPTKDNGIYCTITENKGGEVTVLNAVTMLGKAAAAVIAAGNCASFGGIPAAAPNPTGVVPVDHIVKDKPVINLSLCPMHPDHFLGTVVYMLEKNEIPELDKFKRPKMFYPGPIHDQCWRRESFEAGQFAQYIGDTGCLAYLGCKGFIATSDCQKRGWNNNVNWCIRAGAPCQACSEPAYPDGCEPFYGLYPLTNKENVTYMPVVPNKNTEFVVKKKTS